MLVFETNSNQLSQGLADPENPFNLHISINTRKAYIFFMEKTSLSHHHLSQFSILSRPLPKCNA